VHFATPPDSVEAAQPEFELQVTVPVGAGPPIEVVVTVAVSVTAFPTVTGFGEAVKLVLLVALFTVCETLADFEPYVPFPAKLAVTPSVPISDNGKLVLKPPPAAVITEPIEVEPASKVMVVPAGKLLVPVKVTVSP
jgi:hypothetical protein